MRKGQIIYSISSWLPVTMNWIYGQIKYLPDFYPIIFTDQIENPDQLPDYSVFALSGKWSRNIIKNLRRIGIRPIPTAYQHAIQQYQPRLLHSHFGDRAWFDLPMVMRYGMKQVVTFYGYDLSLLPRQRPVWKKRFQQLFDHADQFLCEGPFMAQSLIDLGCHSDKVKVHHLGVDLDQISFRPRTFDQNGPFKILIAGRFIEKKGTPYALAAIGKFKEQVHEIQVTIIGDSSGSKREECEKARIFEAIDHNDLRSITRLMGFQPHQVLMEQAYEHHVFLSPSVTASDGDTEGGVPVSIIEMLASGMPVVSTDHCDIPGVVKHGISGLLASERNPDELSTHLEWLMENPDRWHEMAVAGRKHVEEQFNARIQGHTLFEIYKKLCI